MLKTNVLSGSEVISKYKLTSYTNCRQFIPN